MIGSATPALLKVLIFREDFDAVAEWIFDVGRARAVTMGDEWAKFFGVLAFEGNMRRVLLGHNQRELKIREIEQGPRIVLVIHPAFKIGDIPIDRLANVRDGNRDVVNA